LNSQHLLFGAVDRPRAFIVWASTRSPIGKLACLWVIRVWGFGSLAILYRLEFSEVEPWYTDSIRCPLEVDGI
jgi:hypothetical protein